MGLLSSMLHWHCSIYIANHMSIDFGPHRQLTDDLKFNNIKPILQTIIGRRIWLKTDVTDSCKRKTQVYHITTTSTGRWKISLDREWFLYTNIKCSPRNVTNAMSENRKRLQMLHDWNYNCSSIQGGSNHRIGFHFWSYFSHGTGILHQFLCNNRKLSPQIV